MTPEEYGCLAAEKWASLQTDFFLSKSKKQLVKAERIQDQFSGFDFYAKWEFGFLRIEAKGENRHTGNLLFEHWSNFNTQRKGWIETSIADYLILAYMSKEIAYIMGMPEAQQLYRERHLNWRESIPHLVQANLTKFYLVPVREVIQSIRVEILDVSTGRIIGP